MTAKGPTIISTWQCVGCDERHSLTTYGDEIPRRDRCCEPMEPYLPPHVRVEAQRILDREARRLLDEKLREEGAR